MKQTILSFFLTLLPIMANADANGTCGENLTWSYVESTKTLIISGTGAMKEYWYSDTPWYNYRSSIQNVIIEFGVTSIGRFAFNGCSGPTSVTIPNSVTSIGNYAFSGCSGLTSVTIPNSVTNIGESAFGGCVGLTSITIPNSVTSIGAEVFSGCSGLTSVTIPNSVTSIGYSAFSGCSGLTSVTIPNSVTSIGRSAFSGCTGLTSVTIPNNVTFIGDYAFSGCTDLTSVTIPNSVTSIGHHVFSSCSSLTSILVESGNAKYDSRDNCNGIVETESNTLIYGCKNTTIPNSVTSIGNEAFYYCNNLTSVTIPNSVTSIGVSAFEGCSELSSITIPNTIKKIGNNAFKGCNNLISLAIPEHITKRTIHVATPGTLNSLIPYDEKYMVKELILTGVLDGGDFSLIRDMAGAHGIYYGGSNTDSQLSVLNLANANIVGGGNEYMREHIDVPGDDYDIEYYMKANEISSYLFYGSDKLNCIILPDNLTSIEASAFSGCSGLTSITIPNSVTNIGEHAFAGCSGLTSIKVESGNLFYDSRNSCNAIIETSTNKLIAGCKKTIIPNDVTSIGNYAFASCSSLTSMTIPNSVTFIGINAFYSCSGLKNLYCKAENVPETDTGAFYNLKSNEINLHVPEGSVEAYKAAEPWKNFNIVALGPQCATPEISFVDNIIKLSCKTEGATCYYEILNEDVKSGSGVEVQMSMTYHISAYATKAGFEPSEIAKRDIVITGNGNAIVLGDVDGDGKVNVSDHVKLSEIIMGK